METQRTSIETDQRMEQRGVPTDIVEGHTEAHSEDTKHEILDRAKHLGRTTLETGTKILHTVEDKIHEYREREVPEETTKRAKMIAGASAGTVLVASTVRRIRHNHAQQKPRLKAPQKLVAKTKEMISR